MSVIWKGTNFKGVRYYEHPTRRHGVGRDKYFAIRYQVNKKRIEEGIGWTSELDPKDKRHWTAEKVAVVLAKLKESARGLEKGPTRLKERRQIEDDRKETEKAEQERQKKEAVTFNTFFNDNYLKLAKADKKPSSVKREEGLYNKWIKAVIGHLPLKEIVPIRLEELKNVMAEGGQSPRSIEYALAIVRQVFNTAKRQRVYDGESPTSQVKSPKVDNGRMRFLTQKEATILLNALKKKSADVHDMTVLSLFAGLRFGEIASLTWQDVDLNKEVLTIRGAKAGSRYAFLTNHAVEMLKSRKQGKPSDYVFPSRKVNNEGEKDAGHVENLTKEKMGQISVTFARTVEELKLNDGIDDPRLRICFHSCRHSYASWLIDQGADLYTVQKLLGHKTNVMTQRYAHLSENRLKDAAKALGAAWQKHAGKEEVGQVENIGK